MMFIERNRSLTYAFLLYFITFSINLIVFPLDIQRVMSLFAGGCCLILIDRNVLLSHSKVIILFLFLFLCSQAVLNSQEIMSFGVFFKYVDYFNFAMIILLSYERINKKLFYKHTYCFFIIVGVVEAYIRYFRPEVALSNSVNDFMIEGIQAASLIEDSFYYFKFASILRFDSNGVAIIYLCLLCVLLIDAYKYINKKAFGFILLVLMFLTLSRSAILASFVLLSAHGYSRIKSYKIKVYLLLLFLSLFLIAMPSMTYYFSLDESGSTKIEVFNNLIVVFKDMTFFEKTFGFGISVDPYNLNLNGIYGHTGHVWVFLTLCYFGMFGVSILLYIFLRGVMRSGGYYIFFAFLVVSLSYLEPLEPLFIFLVFMLNTNLRDNNEKRVDIDK